MVRSRWIVAGLMVVAGLVGSPPGLAAETCDDQPSLLDAQNDASSGADAPDRAAQALLLPSDGDFTGALLLPLHHGPGDPADWFALEVRGGAEQVMIRADPMIENPALQEIIVAELVPPGGGVPIVTVPLGGGIGSATAVEGVWTFSVRFLDAPDTGCAGPSGTQTTVDPVITGYYLYIGCDPVC